jgi:biopolymer transport protein ExbD
MHHSYVAAKPSAITGINIVPLIGVLAALLVVVMTGLPRLTQTQDLGSMNGCNPYGTYHRHVLDIAILSSGIITLDSKSISMDRLSEAVIAGMKQKNHAFFAEIDIDNDASYQDVVSLMAVLEKSGLNEGHIQILDHYE